MEYLQNFFYLFILVRREVAALGLIQYGVRGHLEPSELISLLVVFNL